MTPKEEKIWINKCIARDEQACRWLYERFYQTMFRVCRRYTNRGEEAKDVVQEGFIKVFQKLEQYRFEGSFEGWVRRIMVHEAINNYKKKNFWNVVDSISDNHIEDQPEEIEADDALANIPSEKLLAMVEGLPPAYRLVFTLNAIHGYSHREVAEELGISESTSRANLVKARGKLKAEVLLFLKKAKSYAAG